MLILSNMQAHFLPYASLPFIIHMFLTKLIGDKVVVLTAETVPPVYLSFFCCSSILETFIVAYYTDAHALPSCIRITQLILSTLHNYSSICKFPISHRVF